MCVLKKMGVLIDGVTETIKHEMKKQEGGFLDALITPFAASLVQPMIFSSKRYKWKRTKQYWDY